MKRILAVLAITGAIVMGGVVMPASGLQLHQDKGYGGSNCYWYYPTCFSGQLCFPIWRCK